MSLRDEVTYCPSPRLFCWPATFQPNDGLETHSEPPVKGVVGAITAIPNFRIVGNREVGFRMARHPPGIVGKRS